MQLDMKGQTTLVTGSTSGIGRAVAAELASHGAHVVVNGRSAERGDPVVATIRDASGSAEFRAADINDSIKWHGPSRESSPTGAVSTYSCRTGRR